MASSSSSSSLFMPTSLSPQPPRSSRHQAHCFGINFSLLKNWHSVASGMWRTSPFGSTNLINSKKRRTLICAVNQDPEEAFKKTVEVDRLIDKLREANPIELQKLVVENVLAFNEGFWIRLAARTDTCKSEDDKKDYEELAISVMSIVDRLVHKTNEKINSATDVLKGILKPVVDDVIEIQWPPRDPESLKLMEKEITEREQDGQLDEGFLSEVNAQLRQAKEDGDKPGLEAMLQKVLQLYASKVLSKRSYAKKGDEILKAEEFLESIIKAPEEEWNKLLLNGLSIGKGGWFLPAACSFRVPEWHSIESRASCPSTRGQAAIGVHVHDLKVDLGLVACTKMSDSQN
ncbi:hypothetical protein ACLB2K_016728 [Fragaria x ananassa]